jgi:hypothetical protein
MWSCALFKLQVPVVFHSTPAIGLDQRHPTLPSKAYTTRFSFANLYKAPFIVFTYLPSIKGFYSEG